MSDMFAPWAATIAQIPILNAIPGWAVIPLLLIGMCAVAFVMHLTSEKEG